MTPHYYDTPDPEPEGAGAARQAADDPTTIAALRLLLREAVAAWDDLLSDFETTRADPGCIVCTVGTVPDRWNTGLCWRHEADRLLSEEAK